MSTIVIRLMLVLWVIFGSLVVFYFWARSDYSDFHFSMCFVSMFVWLIGVFCGLILYIDQVRKSETPTSNHTATVEIDIDDSDTEKKPAELKHSNVKISNGKYYVGKLLLADTANNGKLIPRCKAGQAMITMVKFLKQKRVLKTCTGLKVDVQASGTKARYFSENGEKLVVVNATQINKVVETNEDF